MSLESLVQVIFLIINPICPMSIFHCLGANGLVVGIEPNNCYFFWDFVEIIWHFLPCCSALFCRSVLRMSNERKTVFAANPTLHPGKQLASILSFPVQNIFVKMWKIYLSKLINVYLCENIFSSLFSFADLQYIRIYYLIDIWSILSIYLSIAGTFSPYPRKILL